MSFENGVRWKVLYFLLTPSKLAGVRWNAAITRKIWLKFNFAQYTFSLFLKITTDICQKLMYVNCLQSYSYRGKMKKHNISTKMTGCRKSQKITWQHSQNDMQSSNGGAQWNGALNNVAKNKKLFHNSSLLLLF